MKAFPSVVVSIMSFGGGGHLYYVRVQGFLEECEGTGALFPSVIGIEIPPSQAF